MSFLNPLYLIGLSALVVPVIIHLINLRKPERMPFSTIAFFEQLQKSTIKKIKIKEFLLLAIRLLAITFLVLGLSRPFLKPELQNAGSGNTPILYGILVDNSPGMAQIDEKGPYLEQAKQFVSRIINEANASDRFIILNSNGQPLNSNILSRESAEQWVQKLKVMNKGDFIGPRLESLYTDLSKSGFDRVVMYWLSDAQKTQIMKAIKNKLFRASGRSGKVPVPLRFIRIGNKASGNVAITDLSLSNSILVKGKPAQITATVKNFSSQPIFNNFISLKIHNKITGQYSLNLSPKQSKKFMFEVPADTQSFVTGAIVLDGDTYKFDDTRYFSIKMPKRQSVLLVTPPETPVSKENHGFLYQALKAGEETNSQVKVNRITIDRLNSQAWQSNDVIILNGLRDIPDYLLPALKKYVQSGHGLIIFPSVKASLSDYNRLLSVLNAGRYDGFQGSYGSFQKIASFANLTEGHPILNGIFKIKKDEKIRVELPNLYYYWIYKPNESVGSATVLKSNLNDPLLSEQKSGNGIVMISSLGMNPGWSTFPANALFAPVLLRAVLFASSSESGGLQKFTLGKTFEETIPYQVGSVEIKLNNETVKPIINTVNDGQKISYPAEEWSPGLAEIQTENKKNIVAVNQDIMESDFATLTNKDLEKLVKSDLLSTKVIDAARMNSRELDQEIRSAGFGTEIWNWFIWAGLFCLILEIVVAKSYRTETV